MQETLQKILILVMAVLFGAGLEWIANKYAFVDKILRWLGFMLLTIVFMVGMIWIIVPV